MWILLVVGGFYGIGVLMNIWEEFQNKRKRDAKERVYAEWPDKENTVAFLEQELRKVEKYEKKLGVPKDFEFEIQAETYRKTVAQQFAKCPKCSTGYMRERHGKWGPFFGCTNYPACKFTKKVTNIASAVKKKVNGKAKESFTDDFLKLLKQYDV